MRRISLLLAFLLVVLTFNAYACILPLQQSAEMDCTSGQKSLSGGHVMRLLR
jgi:hypothetical protein